MKIEIVKEKHNKKDHVVIPVTVELFKDTLRLEIHSEMEKIALEYAERFARHPFSEKALEYLYENTEKYLEKLGYTTDTYGKKRFFYHYEIDDPSKLCVSKILPSSEFCTHRHKKLINVSGIETEDTGELPEPSCLTEKDGKIVSLCTVNDHSPDAKVIELTISTSRYHRCNGYGSSNTALMAKKLLEEGKTPAYCFSRYNRASKKLIEGLGFEKVGGMYAVIGYKEE